MHFEVNINYYERLGSHMKEIDDTDLPQSESEYDHAEIVRWITDIWTQLKVSEKNEGHLQRRLKVACERHDLQDSYIKALELRVANLETQRTPEMENDDPEWFS